MRVHIPKSIQNLSVNQINPPTTSNALNKTTPHAPHSFAEERRRAKTNHNHNQHKKRPRDSSGVAAEQEEQQGEGSPLDRLTFGVAYNPYLPEEGGLFAEEARRLKVGGWVGVCVCVRTDGDWVVCFCCLVGC